MQSQILNEYTKTNPKVKFNQGDILNNISVIIQTGFDIENQESIFSEITFNYGVVINQECDLEHDFNNRANTTASNQDKFLPNILILPAYLAYKFKEGTHRGNLLKGVPWNGDLWKNILSNQNYRFHHISANEEYQIPDLIIDFKHVYAINTEVLYREIDERYFVSICEIYREFLSHRYSFYLSRIGLPDKSS